MCGIIGIVVKKPYETSEELARVLYAIYKQQKSRGSNGFGFAYTNNNIDDIKRVRTETETEVFGFWNKQHYDKMNEKGTMILFHHRIPTCNYNDEKYNHPFLNEKQDIALIHNGYLYNTKELQQKLEKEKHVFETKSQHTNNITDSEVLLHLYENNKNIEQAITNIENNAFGMLTIILIDKQKNKLIAYKRNEPLVKMENENLVIYASEYAQELKDFNIEEIREIKPFETLTIDCKAKEDIILIPKTTNTYTPITNYPTMSYQTSLYPLEDDEIKITKERLEKRLTTIENQRNNILKKLLEQEKRKQTPTKKTERRKKELEKLDKRIEILETQLIELEEYEEEEETIIKGVCDDCEKETKVKWCEITDSFLCEKCYKQAKQQLNETLNIVCDCCKQPTDEIFQSEINSDKWVCEDCYNKEQQEKNNIKNETCRYF